jgi:DNA-binding GntR family transcriptional regulator
MQRNSLQIKNIIPKSSLGSKAADIIRERIIKSYYQQGSRLIEEELSNEFEISRACIREALLLLESEGMVLRESNKCTRILQFSPKDIEDLFSFRTYLEILAVETIIEKRLMPLTTIRKALNEMNKLKNNNKSNSLEFIEADLNFHEEIILVSTNNYLLNTWKKIKYQIMTLMYSLYNIFKEEMNIKGTDEHACIMEFLECGDVLSAQQVLKKHIKRNFEYIIALSNQVNEGKESNR